jgi:hypothetical protein
MKTFTALLLIATAAFTVTFAAEDAKKGMFLSHIL